LIPVIILVHYLSFNKESYLDYVYALGVVTPVFEFSKFSSTKLILSELSHYRSAGIASIANINQLFVLVFGLILSFALNSEVLMAVVLLRFAQGMRDINAIFAFRLFAYVYELKTIPVVVFQIMTIAFVGLLTTDTNLLVDSISLVTILAVIYDFTIFSTNRFFRFPSIKIYRYYLNYGYNNFINSINNNAYRLLLKNSYSEILVYVEVYANIFKLIDIIIGSVLQSLARKLRRLASSSRKRFLEFARHYMMLSAVVYILISFILLGYDSDYAIITITMVIGRFFATCLGPMKSILQSKSLVRVQFVNYLQVTLAIGLVYLLYWISGVKQLLILLLVIPSFVLFTGTLLNVRKSFSE